MAELTGQIITVLQGDAPDNSDRDCVMVIGVFAAARGAFKDLHQYTIVGGYEGNCILIADGMDRSKELRGMGAAAMLLVPIWRI